MILMTTIILLSILFLLFILNILTSIAAYGNFITKVETQIEFIKRIEDYEINKFARGFTMNNYERGKYTNNFVSEEISKMFYYINDVGLVLPFTPLHKTIRLKRKELNKK